MVPAGQRMEGGLQANHPYLAHSGPLPEPVINGEMEEKVRALYRRNMAVKSRHLQPSISWSLSFEAKFGI